MRYNLPDESITLDEMAAYGYTWGGMLPLRKDRALELFNSGLAVFRLYDDNTEGQVENTDEMDAHDHFSGIFGVDKDDWERACRPDIAKMNFSEFCEYVDGDGCDEVELILYYDYLFEIYREIKTGRYFYLEASENDASEFFEVELAASLCYDVNHDLQIKDCEELSRLFDCVACGERVCDDRIEYLWFARRNEK